MEAHELAETVDCRIPGCIGSTNVTRGPWARLCPEHREKEVMRRRGVAKVEPFLIPERPQPTVHPVPPPARTAPPSLKTAAQAVVPAAAELDKALLHKRTATGHARQAFDNFKAALEQLQADARQALEAR